MKKEKKRKEKIPVVLPNEAVVLFVTSKEAVCRRRSRHLEQGPTGASSRSLPSAARRVLGLLLLRLLVSRLCPPRSLNSWLAPSLAHNTTHYYCLLHGDPRACQEQSFAKGCVCS